MARGPVAWGGLNEPVSHRLRDVNTYLAPSWWYCLGEVEARHSFAGGSTSLGMGFESL